MNTLLSLLIRGLLVGLPLVFTIVFTVWLFGTVESWLSVPMRRILGDAYIPGLGILLGLLIAVVLGIVASTWIGGRILDAINGLMERLPLVKSVYAAIRDIFAMFDRKGNKAFNRAVMVEWGGCRFLGFITRNNGEGLPKGLMNEGDVVVYLPMGYQIGGFPVVVHRDSVHPVDMSIDAALKFALTAGVSTNVERRRL
ncbi:DUF502 domain-containing protein [Geoalkalibacter halelectricus]|uniref:DUF502 domain-containing protein n=1 Tax=Geoalkalibacter halelectricus TaxID=2847045 RepID=UPI003D258C86